MRSANGAPQNLTLRVSQDNKAVLTWGPPSGGGQDSFRILDLTGAKASVGNTTGTFTTSLLGFNCFAVQSMTGLVPAGTSDIVCGMAGVTTLGQ